LADPILYLIILIPIAISLCCKYLLRWEISWLEWGAQFLIGILVLGIIWSVGRYSAASDTEILNGTVQSKNAWRFSCYRDTANPCKNSYMCDPYTVCSGYGKTRSCTTQWHTCYTYSWEQNWLVKSNVPTATEFEIARVDPQGKYEPRRWTNVQLGDAVAATHSYKNWIKGSVNSLFKENADKDGLYTNLMSQYPTKITDYYAIDRVVTPNYMLRNKNEWNRELSKMLGQLGPARQMNMVVVITNNSPREFAHAQRRNWQGFKKNDAVLFVGLRNGQIDWAEVMSWSKNSIFNIELRHAVSDMAGVNIADIEPVIFFSIVRDISMRDFVRRPMKEFEYLKGDIPPPTWLIITSFILAIALGVGTSILFNKVDLDAAVDLTARY